MHLYIAAAHFAAVRHRDHKRKGASEEPYINHLLEVCALLSSAGLDDPELLAAAVLHDSVEDVGVTLQEIEERFGARVAEIVAEVTDDTTLPRHARKLDELARAGGASLQAQAIKVADKTSNIRGILVSPPAGWSHQRKLDYCIFTKDLVLACERAPEALVEGFLTIHAQVLRRLTAVGAA